MALILSARRGWLPAGFTELEYIESSGTQYVNIPYVFNNNSGYCFAGMPMGTVIYVYFIIISDSAGHSVYAGWENNRAGIIYLNNNSDRALVWQRPREQDVICKYNFLNDGIAWAKNQNFEASVKRPDGYFPDDSVQSVSLFASKWGVCRGYFFQLSQGSEITRYFVPVLDANGTPCMYDKISRTCFYNSGSGTFGYRIKTTVATSAPMSLRDPYYTAPSGVYARPSGENELEILADTEMETDAAEQYGFTWFANTGEAYEHFGIKQEALLTNEPTND